MQVNVTTSGYAIAWKAKFAPGRPECRHFVIETKHGNVSWVQIGGNIPRTERKFVLHARDIQLGDRYLFRMYAVGFLPSNVVFGKEIYFGEIID